MSCNFSSIENFKACLFDGFGNIASYFGLSSTVIVSLLWLGVLVGGLVFSLAKITLSSAPQDYGRSQFLKFLTFTGGFTDKLKLAIISTLGFFDRITGDKYFENSKTKIGWEALNPLSPLSPFTMKSFQKCLAFAMVYPLIFLLIVYVFTDQGKFAYWISSGSSLSIGWRFSILIIVIVFYMLGLFVRCRINSLPFSNLAKDGLIAVAVAVAVAIAFAVNGDGIMAVAVAVAVAVTVAVTVAVAGDGDGAIAVAGAVAVTVAVTVAVAGDLAGADAVAFAVAVAFTVAVAGVVAVAVAVAFAIAVAVAVAVAFAVDVPFALAVAFAFAGFVALAFAFAGAVAVAGVVAGVVAVAVAVTVAVAVDGAFAFAVGFAVAIAIAVAGAGAVAVGIVITQIFARQFGKSSRKRKTWLALGGIGFIVLIPLFFLKISEPETKKMIVPYLSLITPLLIIPAVNACFDWLSLGATRLLLMLHLKLDSHLARMLLVLADLLLALLLVPLLIALLIAMLQKLEALGVYTEISLVNIASSLIEPQDTYSLYLQKNTKYLWVYGMVFTTLLPTLLHFVFAICALATQGLYLFPALRKKVDHFAADRRQTQLQGGDIPPAENDTWMKWFLPFGIAMASCLCIWLLIIPYALLHKIIDYGVFAYLDILKITVQWMLPI